MTNNIHNLLEIALGMAYLIGALFSLLYIFRYGDVFYGRFAKSAWLRPMRSFIQRFIIPFNQTFTLLLVFFQFGVSIALFTRGSLVRPGLLAGALFGLLVAIVSNPLGAVANLCLAALQAFLAFTR